MRCAGFERFCADTDTDRCCITLFALKAWAQCALSTVIALKTQKNEKKDLKKYKFAPPTILPAPPLALHFTQCIEMLKNLLVVLKNQNFY